MKKNVEGRMGAMGINSAIMPSYPYLHLGRTSTPGAVDLVKAKGVLMPGDTSVPPPLLATFAPLHKAAFGIAVGLVGGVATAGITAFHLLVDPVNAADLALLNHFFYGYSVSWTGAAVGFLWASFAGFMTGWCAAFVRNFVIAVWIIVIRTRAELSRVSDFLGDL